MYLSAWTSYVGLCREKVIERRVQGDDGQAGRGSEGSCGPSSETL